MKKYVLLILSLPVLCPLLSVSQTLIFSNYNNGKYGNLSYFVGVTEPGTLWYTTGFDDSNWPKDTAVIGHGYAHGKYGYTVIDSTVKSLYVRFSFNLTDKNSIEALNFAPDFDDGFIAYLNGVEIARVNVQESVQFPPFDAVATRSHHAEFGRNNSTVTHPNGFYLDSTLLASCLFDGENIMAVHIINDSIGNDLFFAPNLFQLDAGIWVSNQQHFSDVSARYKKLIETDSTDLPLLIIETDEFGISYDQRYWSTAHMGIVNNGTGKFNKPSDLFNEYNGLISIRSRGQSSRDFSKKSYRFKLVDKALSDTSFALLGMPKESDWILFGPFTDKSQIRNKLAYDLASQMRNYAPRTRFCELMLNGQSEGLYILTENIKRGKDRVDISKLKETDISGEDVTGGYIFKFDKPDAFPSGTTIYAKGREIVYPSAATLEQQNYLIRFLTTYDSLLLKTNDFSDPLKGFRKYASDTSLVDFIILNELVKNPDAYTFSTYMYKDRDDKDGRIKFGPVWDYDIAFGNSQFQQGFSTSGWQFDVNSRMSITRYFQDTEFVKLFRNRWHELRAHRFSNDTISGLIDQLVNQTEFASKRNYEIWPFIDINIFYQAYKPTSYSNEIEILKTWLAARVEWIDSNVDNIYYPFKKVGIEEFAQKSSIQVYPNPFTNELHLNCNLPEKSDVRIEIYSIMGQRKYVYQSSHLEGFSEIILTGSELSELPVGVYYLKFMVNNVPVQTQKLMKK